MLYIARHPLIEHHVAALRDVTTPSAEFRRLASRLAVLLAYAATSDLPLATGTVQTPLATAPAQRLAGRIGLIGRRCGRRRGHKRRRGKDACQRAGNGMKLCHGAVLTDAG